jgi:hypothetical protein
MYIFFYFALNRPRKMGWSQSWKPHYFDFHEPEPDQAAAAPNILYRTEQLRFHQGSNGNFVCS